MYVRPEISLWNNITFKTMTGFESLVSSIVRSDDVEEAVHGFVGNKSVDEAGTRQHGAESGQSGHGKRPVPRARRRGGKRTNGCPWTNRTRQGQWRSSASFVSPFTQSSVSLLFVVLFVRSANNAFWELYEFSNLEYDLLHWKHFDDEIKLMDNSMVGFIRSTVVSSSR